MISTAYAYPTRKTSITVIERIYYLLNKQGWTLKTLAEESDIPYETLKKLMNHKINNPSMNSIVRIASAFHCGVDFLMGLDDRLLAEPSLSRHSQSALQYLSDMDCSMTNSLGCEEKTFVPVYFPDSVLSDANTSIKIDVLDISVYRSSLREILFCGIRIPNHCYHPIFYKQDILLIAQDRIPNYGETGIFMHDGILYIRKYYPQHDGVILEAVNSIGKPISLTSFSGWTIFGYVAGLHRSADC
jgi:transcriptional regulator with XRE-family HTH domain